MDLPVRRQSVHVGSEFPKYDQFGPCVLNALMPRFSFVPILLESLTLFLQSLKRERAEVKALLRLRNRTMD